MGLFSVGVLKGVEDGFGPAAIARAQLEDYAIAGYTALMGGAIKISGVVEGKAAIGFGAVIAAEAVNDGFGPAAADRAKLEDYAQIIGAALLGGAVEMARRVEDQVTVAGILATRTLELVENGLRPLLQSGTRSRGRWL
ncbi:MAG: hypothetical protein WCC25_16675 [Candidatus Korobacteraceae bacterium]